MGLCHLPTRVPSTARELAPTTNIYSATACGHYTPLRCWKSASRIELAAPIPRFLHILVRLGALARCNGLATSSQCVNCVVDLVIDQAPSGPVVGPKGSATFCAFGFHQLPHQLHKVEAKVVECHSSSVCRVCL